MISREPHPAIGIELGSWQCSMSWMDPEKGPRIIRSVEGDRTTPSAVLHTLDQTLVGSDAIDAAVFDPSLLNRFRHDAKDSIDTTVQLLDKLRADAERKVGSFDRAVVAIHDSMSLGNRRGTREAAKSAGLIEVVLLNQSLAAAIAFAAENEWLSPSHNRATPNRMLVYSWGAGPFTAAIIEFHNGSFRSIASESSNQLTGDEFADRVMTHFAEAFCDNFGVDPRQDVHGLAEFRRVSRRAIHALAKRKSVSVSVVHESHRLSITVDQRKLVELTSDLLRQSSRTVQAVLDDAALTWSDIDHLVMSGGLTRMRTIRRMMAKQSGLKPDTSLSVDESISQGAAIHAWNLWNQAHDARDGAATNVDKWMKPYRLAAAVTSDVKDQNKATPRKLIKPTVSDTQTDQESQPARRPPIKKLARPAKVASQKVSPAVSTTKPIHDEPQIEIKSASSSPLSTLDQASLELGLPGMTRKLRPDEISLKDLASFSTEPAKIDTPILIETRAKATSSRPPVETSWQSQGKRVTPKEEA